MLRSVKAGLLFSSALLVGTLLGAVPHASRASADVTQGVTNPAAQSLGAAAQPPHDPNKKNAGEPCKSSDECQKHHTCTKVGDRTICQPPPPPRLPPGAVT